MFQLYDPNFADFILYNLIPFGSALDNLYVALQAFNNPVAQTSLAQTSTIVVCTIITNPGLGLLSQFDELELLPFLFTNQGLLL